MQAEAKVGDLFRVLRRSYRMIAMTVAAGTILICTGPLLIPPRYSATSQILIEPQGLMAPQGSIIELPADEATMQTEIAALTSPDLLQRVLDALATDPAFKAAAAAISRAKSTDSSLWQRLTGWVPVAWFTATGAPGAVGLRQLLNHLHVTQQTGSHVIAVEVTSISPPEAAVVANTLTRLYVESQDQQKRASTDRTLAWLATRAPQMKDEVKRLDAAVQAYRVTNNLAGANPRAVSDGQIEELNRQLAAARTEVATAGTKADTAELLLRQPRGASVAAPFLQSPMLTKLRERESTILQSIAGADHSAGSSLGIRLQSELAEVRQQIAAEAVHSAADLRENVDIAVARMQSINQQLIDIRNDKTDVSLSDLERDAASSHRLYENLLLRQDQLREQRESLSPGVRVLSLAQPPIRPSSINPALFMPPAVMLSLIVATFLAVGKAHFDRTLRSEREVGEVLGISCIGLVPEIRRLRGLRPHDYLRSQQFSPYAEAIRSVVAALRLTAPGPKSKVILVSSSLPAEGKTTLAVSVAVYLATVGRRVIIVDLDFRRPAVPRELGLSGADRGLDDGGGQDRLAKSVQPVAGLPLDYLAAPRGGGVDPLGLLASSHIDQLLQRLRLDYDYVIIDSAPLLAVAEARLLIPLADRTLFVVKWGATRRETAENALSLLPDSILHGADSKGRVNAVVTRVDLRKHARYSYGDSGECLVDYGRYLTSLDSA